MPLALVVRENKKLVIEELPLPKCGPKDLLIKVTHVALNPTDWKYVHNEIAKPGFMVGRDFTGEIVKVGKEVIGLFHEMGLSVSPGNNQTVVLIWGGSTSVGQYAIQLAKWAGCFVITTASPARHDYLKELDADICLDYKDANVVSQIKQVTKNSLAYAFDCSSEKESVKQVCDTLTGDNSQVVTLLPGLSSEIPSNIKEHNVILTTIFGREINIMGQIYKAKPQDKEFAEKFYKLLSDTLLPNNVLKSNKVAKVPGGLNGVEDGFKRMKEKKVTVEKLVLTMAETIN